MSARSKKQNAQRNFGNASSEGAEKWTPKAKDVAGDSQPTPAYGFPAVSADDVKANQAAQQKANATNTANATQWNNGSNYDFLWEATDTKHSAKGQAGTTTVVESDTDYLLLPHPMCSTPIRLRSSVRSWSGPIAMCVLVATMSRCARMRSYAHRLRESVRSWLSLLRSSFSVSFVRPSRACSRRAQCLRWRSS